MAYGLPHPCLLASTKMICEKSSNNIHKIGHPYIIDSKNLWLCQTGMTYPIPHPPPLLRSHLAGEQFTNINVFEVPPKESFPRWCGWKYTLPPCGWLVGCLKSVFWCLENMLSFFGGTKMHVSLWVDLGREYCREVYVLNFARGWNERHPSQRSCVSLQLDSFKKFKTFWMEGACTFQPV